MIFSELPEFVKDTKRLTKKYRSIPDDLETIKQLLEVFPDARTPFSFRINNLGIENCIIKIKKIACKSLKGRGRNSGLRIVYAYFPTEKIETEEQSFDDEKLENDEKIIFIELFHKNEKESENRERILENFK